MKKWSRWIALTALIASLFIIIPGWAKAKDYDPCDPCGGWAPCSFGDLEVGGELLWWKPCIDHLEYAHLVTYPGNSSQVPAESTGNTRTEIKNLCPDWGPGGRIWVYKPSLLCGTCGLGASLTGIYVNHAETCIGTNIDETSSTFIGDAYIPSASHYYGKYTKVKGRFKLGYYDYDVLLSYPCFCSECSVIRPFFGFAGLVVNQKFDGEGINAKITTGEIAWKSSLAAYGLRVGTEYECKFADSFGVFGKVAATIVSGTPNTTDKQVFTDNFENPKVSTNHDGIENECCRCYSGYHLAVGVTYDTCINNLDIIFRVGYEIIEWHNFPQQRKYITNSVESLNGKPSYLVTNSPNSGTRIIGWQGFLIGLGASF